MTLRCESERHSGQPVLGTRDMGLCPGQQCAVLSGAGAALRSQRCSVGHSGRCPVSHGSQSTLPRQTGGVRGGSGQLSATGSVLSMVEIDWV